MTSRFLKFVLPTLALPFVLFAAGYCQQGRNFPDPRPPKAEESKLINDSLDSAYKVLNSGASFSQKTNSIAVLENNFRNERTLFIIIALLDYNYMYNNPGYRESNQKMYENDLIVEKLVKILGNNGNPRSFPTLLNIVIHPERHREATVSAAYYAMMKLKWQEDRQ